MKYYFDVRNVGNMLRNLFKFLFSISINWIYIFKFVLHEQICINEIQIEKQTFPNLVVVIWTLCLLISF